MRACVFVGPTLRAEDLPPDDDIVVLPPVAQGRRLSRRRRRGRSAIGIIDGYFEGVLSVWHKEILWAMAEGIHVFGSASMGALRAAELHAVRHASASVASSRRIATASSRTTTRSR